MQAKQVVSKEELRRESLTRFLNYPNHPLMGVYNINTREVYLWPCVKEKVGMIRSSGEPLKYSGGYRLDKNLQMVMGPKGKLTQEEVTDVNHSRLMPRVVADTLEDLENDMSKRRLTGHEYILELCGELNSLRDYRGFTIIQTNGEVQYIWDSGALNSPYVNGVRQRERGAKVPEEYRDKIKAVVEKWAKTLPERFVFLTRFIVNMTTKENKDFWQGKAPTFASTYLFATSSEVPPGIIEIRNIISDNSLSDKERMQKIMTVAKNGIESSTWGKKDEDALELYRLLAGGSDNLQGLASYHNKIRGKLGLATAQEISAPALKS